MNKPIDYMKNSRIEELECEPNKLTLEEKLRRFQIRLDKQVVDLQTKGANEKNVHTSIHHYTIANALGIISKELLASLNEE